MSIRRRGLSVSLATSLIVGLLVAPFATTQAKAVVFGEEVPEASSTAPWVASIWYTKNLSQEKEFICTGSLIRADIVITAAHCTFDRGFYWVKLGSDSIAMNPYVKFPEPGEIRDIAREQLPTT
jgi:secreted trypsin-like serine protease